MAKGFIVRVVLISGVNNTLNTQVPIKDNIKEQSRYSIENGDQRFHSVFGCGSVLRFYRPPKCTYFRYPKAEIL